MLIKTFLLFLQKFLVMTKVKAIRSSKTYSMKITHPIMGEYYFSYINSFDYRNPKFVFTQNLSKVKKWKNKKSVEHFIISMKKTIKGDSWYHSGSIVIPLGKTLDPKLKNLKNIELINKRYFFYIKNIKEEIDIKKEIKKLDETKKLIKSRSKEYNELLDNIFENRGKMDSLIRISNSITNHIRNYINKDKFINEHKVNETDFLDSHIEVVDSSFNFRKLKLRTLKENSQV